MAVALQRYRPEAPSSSDVGVPGRAVSTGGTRGLFGYGQPGVIMEYLATDFPEPLTTLFYTSHHAQLHNMQPTSEKVFMFPDEFSIRDLSTGLQGILRAASIQHVVTPQTIDAKTEAVTFKHTPKYGPLSEEFKNIFLPLLYGALGTFIHQYRGVETVRQ